jgi:subtilisin family serine protease
MKNIYLCMTIMLSIFSTSCVQETYLKEASQKVEEKQSEGTSNQTKAPVTPITVTGREGNFMAIINDGYSEAAILKMASTIGITIKRYIPSFRMIAFSASPDQIELLKISPLIKDIQVDVVIPMQLNTATTQIRSREVRDKGTHGQGARVCIIDSGMNYHSELPMPEKEYDFVDSDSRAEDENGHGTAVAGIIASQDPDLTLVKGKSGVAPESILLIAKVFGPSGTASGSSIAAALDWCASNNAHVINMSLGHGGYPSSCDTDFTALFSNQTADKGIVVVAASGNDGFTDKVSSPACGSKVIGVGSVSKQDVKSGFSNAGSEVAISAPGEFISTTSHNGGFKSFSGTSAAAPFVAGVAALLKSMPEKPTALKIKDALLMGAKDLGAPGKDPQYGYGRVDAAESYNYIKSTSGGGLTGGTSGGSSGGTTGGSTGGTTGGSTGGTTGGGTGGSTDVPTKFSFGMVTTSNEARSRAYKSSQSKVVQDCPANHYLSDFEVQGTTWFLSPSITWFKLECQSLKSLDTSVQIGQKRGSSKISNNFCGAKKAITALDIKTGSYIKDIRTECADVTYDSQKAGSVKIDGHAVTKYAFGRGFLFDSNTPVDCPANMVAVGLDASYKSDRDEWAFTRLKLRCAPITTSK